MTPFRRALRLALVLVVTLGLPTLGTAGEPTEQLRASIEQLYVAVRDTTPARGDSREATAILDGMFDWTRMAQTSLRGHWQQRTAEERAEFVRLFANLFRRAYVSRIHVIDATRFQYLGDTVDGDRAVVRTKVLTKRGSTLDVDYTMRLADGQRWRVEDVWVTGVSLIDNYRTQFDSVIARSSYGALVARLREAAK